MGTHGLVPREGPVGSLGSSEARAVSSSPKLVGSHVGSAPIGHVLHGVQRPKSPNMRSYAS
ncbi:hypothetical protein CRG98_020825 [Punica granatum]|uniref:Uncharacterized protein n=1 Tax=Punica granatum TaxID=22663 RepID=A0A2I0JTI6_PUNGR|nr:hypothetical protein CRG98_020825 [Punica granatum]